MSTYRDYRGNVKLMQKTRAQMLEGEWRAIVPANHYGACLHCGRDVGKYGNGGLFRSAHGAEAAFASHVQVCDDCVVQVYATIEPGMPVTEQVGSDSYAGTVTRVSESGKTFWFTKDEVRRGLHVPCPDGKEIEVRRSSKDKSWRTIGRVKWRVYVGVRESYRDPHF